MRPLMQASTVALVTATLLGGCGRADGDWHGQVIDSAGVQIVTNPPVGLWGEGEAWSLEEDLRIGAAQGPPEYRFGHIAGIDLGSDGSIYVVDQQAGEVRVFAPDGEFLARIGRPGDAASELGPGAGPVLVGPGDTILIPDAAHRRATRFTRAGASAGTFALPMRDGVPVKWMEGPNHQLIQQALILGSPDEPIPAPRNLLLRRNAAGEVIDTVIELPTGRTIDFSSGRPRMTIFAPEPMWTVTPRGGLVFGTNSEYRLRVHDASGRLERIVQKDIQPLPVTAADQQQLRHLIQQAWERSGMPPQATDLMASALSFADRYPAYADLFGGPDGTLWVQQVQSPEAAAAQGGMFAIHDIGGPAWDVFDDRGRYLGEVRMPARFDPLLFSDDHLYGVVKDEMDVQYVARMELRRGSRGG